MVKLSSTKQVVINISSEFWHVNQSSTDIGRSNIVFKGLNLSTRAWFSSKQQFSLRGRELFSVGGGVISWYLRVSFQGYQKVGRQLILTFFPKNLTIRSAEYPVKIVKQIAFSFFWQSWVFYQWKFYTNILYKSCDSIYLNWTNPLQQFLQSAWRYRLR